MLLSVSIALGVFAAGVRMAFASSAPASSKLSVKLTCVDGPCGTYVKQDKPGPGHFMATTTGFPANAKVAFSVTMPDGQPYSGYDHPGSLYGLPGGVLHTDGMSQLYNSDGRAFYWTTNNNGAAPDPPGIYKFTFKVKVDGKIQTIKTQLKQHTLS